MFKYNVGDGVILVYPDNKLYGRMYTIVAQHQFPPSTTEYYELNGLFGLYAEHYLEPCKAGGSNGLVPSMDLKTLFGGNK